MSIGWFICPYKRGTNQGPFPTRYCAMDDFTNQINAVGGTWSETEILGNHAIVKVRATDALLTTINAAGGFTRLPKNKLDEPLSDLSPAVKTILRNKLNSLGYTLLEIQEALGDDIGSLTMRDLLRFASRRRLKPRYDRDTDTIILDGPTQPVRSIDNVDGTVKE